MVLKSNYLCKQCILYKYKEIITGKYMYGKIYKLPGESIHNDDILKFRTIGH